MMRIEKDNKFYTGYEYMEVYVESSKASFYIDAYENFGWRPDENHQFIKESGDVTLYLKRDRKIMNKTELTRLQRNFEDCLHQIDLLENSKTSKATIISIATGILGTGFMAGSVFAITAATPIIWLCALLAIPAFIGWISPIFLFKKIVKKQIEIVTPLIEDKYDEIYEICEKGNKLLN